MNAPTKDLTVLSQMSFRNALSVAAKLLAIIALSGSFGTIALAQDAPKPRAKPGSSDSAINPAQNLLDVLPQILGAPPSGSAPDQLPIDTDAGPAEAKLIAKLVEDGEPIPFGVVWRIYDQNPDQNGTYPLLATGNGGTWTQTLQSGSYLVHASYGKASSTALLRLVGKPVSETVILSAGGLRLQAQLTGDVSIPADKVRFRITERDSDTTDEKLIVEGARPGLILPLNAGTFRVESLYGSANASVSADITVEEGKLTDATLYHRAAEVTLKLVNETGGEAIANTRWTVLYPNGEIIAETVGAFPEYVLEEGDYAVVATHEGVPHNRNFSVEAGRHRDVEVLITTE
ncbi:MAG: hypothetical protein ABJO09_09610 [Hyphomicrobiales bacterium]